MCFCVVRFLPGEGDGPPGNVFINSINGTLTAPVDRLVRQRGRYDTHTPIHP